MHDMTCNSFIMREKTCDIGMGYGQQALVCGNICPYCGWHVVSDLEHACGWMAVLHLEVKEKQYGQSLNKNLIERNFHDGEMVEN